MDDADDAPTETMTLKLHALQNGAYTQLKLTGPMPTVPEGKDVRRLLALLAGWHGSPIDVVLCGAPDTAGWLEIWDAALAAVPARHHRVRFLINRSTRAVGDGHDG
ncbi:MAG: hypothetical protein AAB295_10835 [Chloroflexota bacterium]